MHCGDCDEVFDGREHDCCPDCGEWRGYAPLDMELETIGPVMVATRRRPSTGDSGPESGVDIRLLTQVVAGVEEALDRDDLELDPDHKGELVGVLYGHFQAEGGA